MPRIRCHYLLCIFIDDGYCSAASVEIDPEEGCLTYSQSDDLEIEDEWEEEEDAEWAEIEDIDDLEEDDDLWLDDDDDF